MAQTAWLAINFMISVDFVGRIPWGPGDQSPWEQGPREQGPREQGPEILFTTELLNYFGSPTWSSS